MPQRPQTAWLSTVSDRVRDELAYILERCNIRIIAERQGSHRQMSSFMLREGSFLLKQPDIIIPDLDGPRSFTLIDVKIFESSTRQPPPMQTHLPNLLSTATGLLRRLVHVNTSVPAGDRPQAPV